MALPERQVQTLWQQVQAEFGERHATTREFLRRRFEEARPCLRTDEQLSEERELLLGAYFSHEYSLEAAALFNPSMRAAPRPIGPPSRFAAVHSQLAGHRRRWHISSITFRTGFLDAQGNITVNAPTRYCLEPAQVPNAPFEKNLFERKLRELGLVGDFTRQALQCVGDSFTLGDLRAAVCRAWR